MAIITGTLLDDALALTAGASLDTLTGLAGNDVILVALPGDLAAGDKIDGGTGYDRLWFTSTNANDTLFLITLRVTAFESVQAGDGAGNTGGTVALNINAAALAAVATGFTLVGNDGVNLLTGTAGADIIIGNGGTDSIVGGLGKDRVVMDVTSIDNINAGALAESNTLALVGIAPELAKLDLTLADQLVAFGATLDDALLQTGFANVDASGLSSFGVQVTASSVKNVLIGSAQDDVFIYAAAAHLGTDIVSGGVGDDVIRFTSTTAAQALTLTAAVTGVEMAMISDADGVTTGVTALNLSAAAVKSAMKLTGNDGKNLLTGTAFADVLNGNGGADTLTGGAGNDIFVVDSQADAGLLDKYTDAMGTDDRIVFTSTVAGETLTFGTGAVTGIEAVYTTDLAFALGNVLNLNVNGSALTVGLTYVGNAGANIFTGGTGNDKFTGNAGTDSIVGGAGADTIVMDVSSPDSINAGRRAEGNILMLVGNAGAPVAINFNVADDVTDQVTSLAQTQAGLTHIDASKLLNAGLIVTGASGANSIAGSGQDDVFLFELGSHLTTADRITGGDGEDSIRFTAAVAGQTLTLPGAYIKGVEIAEIADANGDTSGTTALNIVAATMTAITLRGNDGANKLTGGVGADTIVGNGGSDTLTGGAGNDAFIVESAADYDPVDALSDQIVGGLGEDVLRFAATSAEVLTLTNRTTGLESVAIADLDGDPSGTTALDVNAAAVGAALKMRGNAGDNALTGTAFADSISGAEGADSLLGGSGNDTLEGAALNLDADGADSLSGGAGNDSLVGGEGADTVFGGTGADIIMMSIDSFDEIDAGARSEHNVLRLEGETPMMIVIDLALDGDQILNDPAVQRGFLHVEASQLMADEFRGAPGIVVFGTAGADSGIIGSVNHDEFWPGLGADTISGGGGPDSYIVRSLAEFTGDVYNDQGDSFGDHVVFALTSAATIKIPRSWQSFNGRSTGIEGFEAGLTRDTTYNINLDASGAAPGVTLVGNAGSNKLTGTIYGDTLFDFGGRDTLTGGVGSDDYVIAGTWVAGDRIVEKPADFGFDTLFYAADGTDILVLTSDMANIEKFVVSGPYDPIGIGGGAGPYRFDIGYENDVGFDASNYGVANATNTGYHIAGSYGDNVLIGTRFNDTLIGWNGSDTITGGPGADEITMSVAVKRADEFDPMSAIIGINYDAIDAGAPAEGNRMILTGAAEGILVFDLSSAVDQLPEIGGAAETLVQLGFQHVDARDVVRSKALLPEDPFGVILIASSAANTMTGSSGDDAFGIAMPSHLSGDLIQGGFGNDVVRFISTTGGQTLNLAPLQMLGIEGAMISDYLGDTTGTTPLNLSAAAFTIIGMPLALAGNDGANLITGTAFADTINGNAGADTLAGGLGNDLYVVMDGAHLVAGDAINDSGGLDTLRFASPTAVGASGTAVLTALMAGLERVEITDAEGRPQGNPGGTPSAPPVALNVDASLAPNALQIRGNDAVNTITGTAYDDSIDGFGGVDSIVGGGGADRITIVLEDDPALAPMDSFDDIDAGAIGDAGGNTLVLQGKLVADDTPPGALVWDLSATGAQLVSAPSPRTVADITHLDFSGLLNASVTITGSSDGNKLVGTALDDTFITASEFAVGDQINGGAGNDTLRFSSANDGDTLLVNGDITGIEFVELTGAADLNVNAGLAANALKITGNGGANSITGGSGNDTVSVDVAADDTLAGGAGSDMLLLTGAAARAITVNLALPDQIDIAGTQSGFEYIDASGVTGFEVNVTGTAADNVIGINAGQSSLVDALGGNDTLLLGGAATALVTVDLTALDQVTPMAGNQSGFENFDASAMTGFGVNVTGSSAANRIIGTALADSIAGGAGADAIGWDVTGADTMDGGNALDGDTLVLTGAAAAAVELDLSLAGADQITGAAEAFDFQHIDASALEAFGIEATGNGLDNTMVGSLQADTFTGLAGADTFFFGGGTDGDEMADKVIYERPSDGAGALAAAFGFDRIKEFETGKDAIGLAGEFNGGACDLDDVDPDGNLFWATDTKANFVDTHEALLVSSTKSLLTTEAQLAGGNFVSVIGAIKRAGGVAAGTGDDGIIVVQTSNLAGVYYYLESDGVANAVSAGELSLLAVVDAKLTAEFTLL